MGKWVSLHRKWDWRNGTRSMRCFDPGTHFVTDAQADEAIRVGAGHVVPKPAGVKVDKRGNRSQP